MSTLYQPNDEEKKYWLSIYDKWYNDNESCYGEAIGNGYVCFLGDGKSVLVARTINKLPIAICATIFQTSSSNEITRMSYFTLPIPSLNNIVDSIHSVVVKEGYTDAIISYGPNYDLISLTFEGDTPVIKSLRIDGLDQKRFKLGYKMDATDKLDVLVLTAPMNKVNDGVIFILNQVEGDDGFNVQGQYQLETSVHMNPGLREIKVKINNSSTTFNFEINGEQHKMFRMSSDRPWGYNDSLSDHVRQMIKE